MTKSQKIEGAALINRSAGGTVRGPNRETCPVLL
jgi:hypothetical protein